MLDVLDTFYTNFSIAYIRLTQFFSYFTLEP